MLLLKFHCRFVIEPPEGAVTQVTQAGEGVEQTVGHLKLFS